MRGETTAKRRGKEGQISERNDEKLATKKQREAIHKFGVQKIPKDLSRKEASEILNELIGYSKENGREAIIQLGSGVKPEMESVSVKRIDQIFSDMSRG